MWGSGSFVPDGASLILGSNTYTSIEFQNPINLGNTSRTVQVPVGTAILSGPVVGNGNLTKTGSGVLSLNTLNYYDGKTIVAEGALRLNHPYALPGGIDATGGWDNLTFMGGVLESVPVTYNFQRSLGTGPGQVQFLGSGGFSAHGIDAIVNFGGASETITWNSGGFVPDGSALIFSGASATAAVDFQNPINLGDALRTIQVNNGSADVDARLSNSLSGNGGLKKTGDGTLELITANFYNGETRISDGVLRLSHPNALPGGLGAGGGLGNLNLNGGVLEWTGDLYRGVGTGADRVQFTGNGAFRPLGTNSIINLGGTSQTLFWNSGGFVPDGNALNFDTTYATIEFQNSIDLNNSIGIIQVDSGPDVSKRAIISGSIQGNGGLTKTGSGTLELTTASSYPGVTTVSEGALRLSHANALPGGCGVAGGASNLNMDGGAVELAVGNFFRSLGAGPSQVQFHKGSFVALGANRIVNFGGASTNVTWGSPQTSWMQMIFLFSIRIGLITPSIFKIQLIWAL